jgi:DNA helicase HerA-like ATPase
MLSELFEQLPEVGDPPKPKLVFFFDEAHLLFDDAPKALIDKVEQVVKLVRSKGVGVYFVTQNPIDVPDAVLSQLSNRVQHALRAYTPRDQKAVKVAAETFRTNPAFSTEDVITQLGIGEALVSVLEDGGVPSVVSRTLIRPPSSRVGAIAPEERQAAMSGSPVGAQYNQVIDRESAFEVLQKKAATKTAPPPASAPAQPAPQPQYQPQSAPSSQYQPEAAPRGGPPRYREDAGPPPARRASNRESVGEAAMKSLARNVSGQLGRALVRGILGSLSKGLR